MRRAWSRRSRCGALVAAGLVALACSPPRECAAAGQEPPRIVGVMPARRGDLLVCEVRTVGLPGEKLSLSMQSGLVSSVELFLDLLDGEQRVCAGNHISFQLAFDLWEEVFAVEEGGRRRRFPDLEALQAYLARLRDLPVAPLSSLQAGERFEVRVGFLLHPVAPEERERVADLIVGDGEGSVAESGGSQEVSISLGRLIRLFYRGEHERPRVQSEAGSAWFRPEELEDATP